MKTNTLATTKKLTTLSMLGALAFIVMVFGRIPIVPVVDFLKYDPKDIIITIAGFIYGPLAAFLITVIVSTVEMFTVSTTWLIGLAMNIISGSTFACTAAFIYKKKKSLKSAVLGLVAACILTTAVMVLWNYFLTPLFMSVPREMIVKLLIPGFIPFNLIKGGINAALIMLLYKPVKAALQASNLMPSAPTPAQKGKINIGVIIASGFVILTCVLWVLVLQGKL